VADLSRAILNLTESDGMSAIERKWFGDAEGCAAQGSQFTSDSLSFASFWGLFLITGATSLLCCAVHLATFLVVERRWISEVASTPHVPWKDRVWMLLKRFDHKDLSSHTFRAKDGGGPLAGRSADDAGASPGAAHIAAGSPLSVSNQTYDMSEWSFDAPSPAPASATGEIVELAAGDEAAAEVAAAPNPNLSCDQTDTGHLAGN